MMKLKHISRCFNDPFNDLDDLFEKAFRITQNKFNKKLHFFIPSLVHYESEYYTSPTHHRFPGVSITGTSCHLNCDHCSGKILNELIPATTPDSLYNVCKNIKEQGGRGLLISGGSFPDGHVPLEPMIPMIKRIKKELDLQVVVHTGILTPALTQALAEAGIDAAMFDIIGTDETLHEIYHVSGSVKRFDQNLSILETYGIPTVPHIIAGLHYGKLKGERAAIEIISKHHPKAVVIVAFMPLADTPMAQTPPLPPEDFARVILATRLALPNIPLLLGCARPRGEHKIASDLLAIKAGINGIAYPCEEAVKYAIDLGFEYEFHDVCCSLIGNDLLLTE